MNNEYDLSNLLNLWEEDFLFNKSLDLDTNLEAICPSNKIIVNILSYANLFHVYSPSLKDNIELCLS